LWLSDSAIRIGVARGSGGEGAGGSSRTLPPCGQLTRCFSAVAELLVLISLQDDLWGSAMFLKEANSISVELKKKVTNILLLTRGLTRLYSVLATR